MEAVTSKVSQWSKECWLLAESAFCSTGVQHSCFCFQGLRYVYFALCTEFLTWAFGMGYVGTPCFRGYGRRDGERRRKSVRGCIVSQDLSVINLVIVKKGENDLPGLTYTEKPRMRGPKRASKIRKLFNLSKDDDVRKYVNTYRRTFTTKNGEWFFALSLWSPILVWSTCIWMSVGLISVQCSIESRCIIYFSPCTPVI